jgi:hypothetical protein
MSNLASVQAALEQARQAAAGAAPPQAPAIASAPSLPAVVAGGRPVSMREMLAESAVSVDAYLKLRDTGFTIGDDVKTTFDDIKVRFKFSDAKPFYGVRYGNPAKYEKSLDRIVNVRNKRPWAECVAEAMRADSRCRGDYRSLDLAFTMVETLTAKDGKTVLIEAGQKLGWTASVTNWKFWVEFAEPFYKLMDAGVITDEVMVEGTIHHEVMSNKENTWSVLTFVDCDIVDCDIVGLNGDEGQDAAN